MRHDAGMGWWKDILGGRRATSDADEWVSQTWETAPPPQGLAEGTMAFDAATATISSPGTAPPVRPPPVRRPRRDTGTATKTPPHHDAAEPAKAPADSERPTPEPPAAPPIRGLPAEMPPFPSTGPHGHRGRMREKLLERGPEALADYELLEMLLFFAFKTGDTKPLAKSLINRYGSFAAVLAAPPRELLEARGLGPHSVSAIKLVQASALRLARAEVMERPVLNNWERLVDYLTAALARERVEQVRVLFLDPRNRLIADEALGKGTVNHTPIYPREVVKRALEVGATAMILVHNHPSGDPTPSRADVDMTAEVKAAAAVFGIVLHDHLIVGNGKQTSLRREGLL